MSVNEFADAQKSHYTVFPRLKKAKTAVRTTPFVKLLGEKESDDRVAKRWELYHQLHSHFHSQVSDIVENIEVDLKIKYLIYYSIKSSTPRRRRQPSTRYFFWGLTAQPK